MAITKSYDISKALADLVRARTYTGFFLTRLRKQAQSGGFLAGVMYDLYTLTLTYCPEKMSKLEHSDQVNVLEHEAYHIINKHIFYSENYLKQDNPYINPMVLNMAYDLAVNSYIGPKVSEDLYKISITPQRFGLPDFKSHAWYLEKMLEEMKDIDETEEFEIQMTGPPQSGSGGGGESGGPQQDEQQSDQKDEQHQEQQQRLEGMSPDEKFREFCRGLLGQSKLQEFFDKLFEQMKHSWDMGDKDMSEEEKNIMRHTVNQTIRDSYEACKRNRGTMPGNLQETLEKIMKEKLLPWNVIFRNWISSAINTMFQPAYNRFDRRYGTYPGKKREIKADVMVVFDTSGSMSSKDLQDSVAELHLIQRYMNADVTLIQCDTRVQGHTKFRKGTKIEIHGRGGTDFRPVFEYIQKKKLSPDVLVFFTDGEGPAPDKAPKSYPVIWVYTSGYHRKQDWGFHLQMSP